MKSSGMTRVWDPLVRIVHWSLVAAFAVCYFTQERNYDLHLDAGYTILGLVAIRTIWGFVGTRYARFASFIRGPARTLGYLRDLARDDAPRSLGHNPAGGAMTVVLLLVLVALTVSGMALDAAENRSGPLTGYSLFHHRGLILDLHVWGTNLALVLVALHLIGVAASSLVHRENLVAAMLTGKKRAPEPSEARSDPNNLPPD
jgi:cytochrome b